ncbi:SGNH/GDSL hydrolase family protein [Actinomadura keratinilytica]
MARRIAAGAAYGGGGIGLLGVAGVGVLLAEAQLAKRSVGSQGNGAAPPRADGVYGRAFGIRADGEPPLEPLRFLMLGDSTAAGQGVHRSRQTPAALLASGLAAVAERPVELRNVAVPGARSDDLDRQVSLALADGGWVPDVCVLMVGANDVTHRMAATESVRLLASAVRRLRTAGAEVVVGTCPDLGTIEPVYQPLRWLARRASRQLAAAQTIGTVEQGGRTVSSATCSGPSSHRTRANCSAPTTTTPRRRGTRQRRWRYSPPSAPRSDSGPRASARRPPATRASCPWPAPPPAPPPRAAPRSPPQGAPEAPSPSSNAADAAASPTSPPRPRPRRLRPRRLRRPKERPQSPAGLLTARPSD